MSGHVVSAAADATVARAPRSERAAPLLPRQHERPPGRLRAQRRSWRRTMLVTLDQNRGAVMVATAVLVAAVTALPIAFTPLRSDDLINSKLPTTWTGTTAWERLQSAAHGVVSLVKLWMTSQGRFFPGSATWTAIVFGSLQDSDAYKLFLAGLTFAMILLTAALVAQITASRSAAVVVCLMLATTVTLRAWFDGLDTFSGVLPLTVCLAIVTTLVLVRGHGRTSIAWAVVMWSFALTTYEVVILLTPVVALLVWWLRRSASRALVPFGPSVALGLFVLWLRSRVRNPAEPYVVNPEATRVLAAAVKQYSAALPLTQQWYPGARDWVRVNPSTLGVCVLMVGVPVSLGLVAVARSRPAVTRPQLRAVAGLGLALWILPSALVPLSLKWQNELPRGQGYVSVVWGYVGVALLLTAGWLALARVWARRPTSRWRAAALGTATLVACVLASATAAQSMTIARALALVAG